MSLKDLNLQPIEDRIILEPVEETRSKGGLVVPDLGKEKSKYATVLAVGPGRVTITGALIPSVIKVGDTVVYPKFGCHTVEVEGKEYLVIREGDLFAKVK